MTCKTCGGRLGRGNKTGHCKAHINQAMASPERSAKISAGLKRHFVIPENKERARETCRANCMTEYARQRRQETAKAIGLHLIGSAAITPEALLRRGAKQSATKLAWCPRELRAEYTHLIRSKKFSAAEAREMILAQHEQDMERFRRELLEARAA